MAVMAVLEGKVKVTIQGFVADPKGFCVVRGIGIYALVELGRESRRWGVSQAPIAWKSDTIFTCYDTFGVVNT